MAGVARTAEMIAVPRPAPVLSLPPRHPACCRAGPAPGRRLPPVSIAHLGFNEKCGVVLLLSGPVLYQSLSSIAHITAAGEILGNLKNISLINFFPFLDFQLLSQFFLFYIKIWELSWSFVTVNLDFHSLDYGILSTMPSISR